MIASNIFDENLGVWLINEDCQKKLKEIEDNTIDSLITDPPAGISFMNQDWDDDKGGKKQWKAWMQEVASECYRVLKPGAHGLVWALPRTSHWTADAFEDARFEVRDVVTHIFGSGFPKSLDISKAIDKMYGAEREVIGEKKLTGSARILKGGNYNGNYENKSFTENYVVTTPTTEDAKKWQGWGTALKPASEHWILIRKPLSEKTVAANVLKHGTGGLNIDASRIETKSENLAKLQNQWNREWNENNGELGKRYSQNSRISGVRDIQGRFPANLVLSHNDDCEYVGTKEVKAAGGNINSPLSSTRFKNTHQQKSSQPNWKAHGNGEGKETVADYNCTEGCAVKLLDEQSGERKSSGIYDQKNINSNGIFGIASQPKQTNCYNDSGGVSRFFYCAKSSKLDKGADNTHPTVKNTKLMEYLIKLITPEGGIVLDPFLGSGSTGVAAIKNDFKFIGIEKEQEYFEIAKNRIIRNAS